MVKRHHEKLRGPGRHFLAAVLFITMFFQITPLFAQEDSSVSGETGTSSESADENDGQKKFKYVFFPAYDYRPGFDHTLILMNKFIFNMDEDKMLISDLTAIKSISNLSWIIQNANTLYTENWRFGLNANVGYMMNEMAAGDLHSMFSGMGNFGTGTLLYGVYGDAQRKIAKNLYAGIGYEYLHMDFTMKVTELNSPFLPDDITTSTTLLTPRLSLEYDSRDNVIYPTSGFLLKGTSNFVTDSLGSKIESAPGLLMEDYLFTRNYITGKFYHSFFDTWKSVLAAQVKMRAAYGKDLPLALYENANQHIRGYRAGDFSGSQLYNFDIEYRQYLTNRIGVVGFASVGFVGNSIEEAFTPDRFVPGVGAGLRLMLAQEQKVAFRADVAFGRDGNWSLYFGLSEFF